MPSISTTQLKRQLLEARVRHMQAKSVEESSYAAPHRRYHTQVYRQGDKWVCTMFSVDRGDMFTNTPYGMGATPAKACADFDQNWFLEC